MANISKLVVISISALLAGCATVSPVSVERGAGAVQPPSLGFLSNIRAPSGHQPVLRYSARGAQVFRCERRDAAAAWVFRQPDAELLDASGQRAGRHGANFSFEHDDGSRLLATIVAHDEAPNQADLRWLLMSTRSFGKGTFENISHVQRVNTRGGVPPPQCEAREVGKLLRVDFSADFVFYRPQSD